MCLQSPRPGAVHCCCYRHLYVKEIGEGSSAKVYQLFYRDKTPLRLAVKKFKKKDCEWEAEYKMIASLSHDNIVKFVGRPVCVGGKYCLFMEMEQGSLESLYKSRKLQDHEIRRFAKELLTALQHLHSEDIVHRDVRGANCLVGKGNNLKLADFEKAEKLKDGQATGVHRSWWRAPEADVVYTKGADVWAFGRTVLELFLGKTPNESLTAVPIPSTVPKIARKFIERCLVDKESERPTVDELLRDEYMKDKEPMLGLDLFQTVDDVQKSANGVHIFTSEDSPPFLERAADSRPASADNLSSCCLNIAERYKDEEPDGSVDNQLKPVREIFGSECDSRAPHSCCFLGLSVSL
ncbi:hypothetical protein R1sor_008177 [Riccia sorocarpa]|uniref:Protein kinase domain-containing protein n=1 Tax=Riccia sorocarpa TaxID=122646 RepID=A0ABD3HWS9_9MARC